MRGEGIKIPQPLAFPQPLPTSPPCVHHFCLVCFYIVVHFMLSCLSSHLAVLIPRRPSHLSVSSSSISSSRPLPSLRPSITSLPAQCFTDCTQVTSVHQPAILTPPPPTELCYVAPYFLTHSPLFLFSLLEEINPAFHLSRMVSSSLSMKYMWKSNCTINFCLPFLYNCISGCVM